MLNKILHWPRKKVFAFLVRKAGLENQIKRYGVESPEELYERLVSFTARATEDNPAMTRLKQETEHERKRLANG